MNNWQQLTDNMDRVMRWVSNVKSVIDNLHSRKDWDTVDKFLSTDDSFDVRFQTSSLAELHVVRKFLKKSLILYEDNLFCIQGSATPKYGCAIYKVHSPSIPPDISVYIKLTAPIKDFPIHGEGNCKFREIEIPARTEIVYSCDPNGRVD